MRAHILICSVAGEDDGDGTCSAREVSLVHKRARTQLTHCELVSSSSGQPASRAQSLRFLPHSAIGVVASSFLREREGRSARRSRRGAKTAAHQIHEKLNWLRATVPVPDGAMQGLLVSIANAEVRSNSRVQGPPLLPLVTRRPVVRLVKESDLIVCWVDLAQEIDELRDVELVERPCPSEGRDRVPDLSTLGGQQCALINLRLNTRRDGHPSG